MCINMLSFGFPLSPIKRSIFTLIAQPQFGAVPRHRSHRCSGKSGYETETSCAAYCAGFEATSFRITSEMLEASVAAQSLDHDRGL